MKRFNPEKELKKQNKKYTKKHLVFSLLGLICFTILGISFAYYEVSGSSLVIDTSVDAPIKLVVYLEGEEVSDFPSKSSGFGFDSMNCVNGSNGFWNEDTWKLTIDFFSNDVCSVYFEPVPYTEKILVGSDPVLDSKMLPVNISDAGVVTIADEYLEWYSYANKEWANAVIVDTSFTNNTPGTVIPMDKIEQMYVWIPRYSYDLASIVSAYEAIDVTFVNNTQEAHPAFTFGDAELDGLWVGKFEQGEDNRIIPNVNSMHEKNIYTLYDTINNAMNTHSLDVSTDVHMMKNTEWGLVAYFSQSKYGVCNSDGTCSNKVANNNYFNDNIEFDIVTGCGGIDTAVANNNTGIDICPSTNRWNTVNGMGASTTNNITGIYDMAGGRYEFVMGTMLSASSSFDTTYSGFSSVPDSKYYDAYVYGTSSEDYSRGIVGDGVLDINPTAIAMPTWHYDYFFFLNNDLNWVLRGGMAEVSEFSGIWNYYAFYGVPYASASARSVAVIK